MSGQEIFLLSTLWFILLCIAVFLGNKLFLLQITKLHRKKQADSLRFIQIKVAKNPIKTSESDSWETASSMKQNIEIMNQVYKNFYAIFEDSRRHKNLGNNYISMELLIERESIKFIVGIPEEHFDTIEKAIGGFYPGCITELIDQPKLLEAGKYVEGGEFVLTKPSIFPIRSYESFEADPMDSILSSYSKVLVDEKLCLQILIQPLEETLFKKLREKTDKVKKKKKGIWNLLLSLFKMETKDEKHEEEKNYEFGQNQLGDLDKKLNDEIFSVKIKALATSPDPSRPKKIITDLAKSFFQYTYTGLNGFKFKASKHPMKFARVFVQKLFFSDHHFLRRLFSLNKHMILNIKELSSILHFPHPKFNKNPRIKWQDYKVVPAPDNLPKEGMLIGYNTYGGNRKEVRINFEDRFRHVYILWQTGTGKTTLMIKEAIEDMKAGHGFTFLDPHGDACEDLLSCFPKERIDDLIYFDLANTEYPIAFNPLDGATTDDERDVVTNDLVEMFVNMYGEEIFGPRIQDYFRNACFLLMEQPEGGTLVDIMRLFTDDAYVESKIRNVKNPVIAAWWNKTYKKMGDREKAEIIPFIQAKFGPFTTSSYVRNIIGQPKSSFNFSEAMQQKKIILCNLSKGLVGEINSQLIGRMITMQLKLAALKRASMDQKDRVPHFLYIDEFQNYVSKSIESILSEARKYRLGLNVAHQYLDQLKQAGLGGDVDLTKPIFGNIGTMFVLKVGSKDAEELEHEFTPEFSKNDLVNMALRKGVMKMSVDSAQSRPFSFEPIYWKSMDLKFNAPEKKEIMKQISALKWGTKRELVDKEIYFRVGV